MTQHLIISGRCSAPSLPSTWAPSPELGGYRRTRVGGHTASRGDKTAHTELHVSPCGWRCHQLSLLKSNTRRCQFTPKATRCLCFRHTSRLHISRGVQCCWFSTHGLVQTSTIFRPSVERRKGSCSSLAAGPQGPSRAWPEDCGVRDRVKSPPVWLQG